MHLPHRPVRERTPNRDRRAPSVLGFRRRQLTAGAVVFTAMLATLPLLPAVAGPVVEEQKVVALQSFAAPATIAEIPEIIRPDYSITEFSVVQSPVAPGTGVLSAFGGRASPCAGCSSFHSGTDFAVGDGNPVTVITDGVVTEVGPDASLGEFVKVEHVIDGQTVTSTYAHMGSGSVTVAVGMSVQRGQQIGIVGMTGAATAPHLHFEIRLGGPFGTAVNALPWLANHVNA